MAKKGSLFGDITAELFNRAQGKPASVAAALDKQEERVTVVMEQPTEVPPVAAPVIPVVVEQPTEIPAVKQPTSGAARTDLQGKLVKQEKKQKKNYDYGTKHTFPIPDELWRDAMLLMQAQGLSQVDFIQGLIRSAVEANRGAIKAVKQMRGEL